MVSRKLEADSDPDSDTKTFEGKPRNRRLKMVSNFNHVKLTITQPLSVCFFSVCNSACSARRQSFDKMAFARSRNPQLILSVAFQLIIH